MSLIAELKRRNVIRAAVLYVGAVWALSQGIAQLGPFFGMPEWGVRWLVIAAAIGFPFWIVFAWVYEGRRGLVPAVNDGGWNDSCSSLHFQRLERRDISCAWVSGPLHRPISKVFESKEET